MIESIEFKNFKVLRDAKLPLGRCNILVGPNGSGKTTVLQALAAVRSKTGSFNELVSVGRLESDYAPVEVRFVWGSPQANVCHRIQWTRESGHHEETELPGGEGHPDVRAINDTLRRIRIFSFEAHAIGAPAQVSGGLELDGKGAKLAAVLDGLRDEAAERFDAINAELGHWLPEFDRILFDRPAGGSKAIALRTRHGHHKIPAHDLSQGTLIALALLTLAYLPEPPSIVGLEEPDRGIHPRLLRRVKDAIYRLAYPESCGEKREPVQVIATTHSPYFLDLFREHPEEVVICEKVGLNVQFRRLSDLPNIEEIIGDVPLGEAWHTGVLGGVPSEP